MLFQQKELKKAIKLLKSHPNFAKKSTFLMSYLLIKKSQNINYKLTN